MPLHLLAFIAEQVSVSPDAISAFARRKQTRYEHLAALRSRFGFRDLTSATKADLKQWLAPIALKITDGHAVLVALTEEMRRQRIIMPGISVIERMAAEVLQAAEKTAVRLIIEIMDKLDKVRAVGVGAIDLPPELGARVEQMVREGLRFTAQAFQQMGSAQRTSILTATLRDIEASLVDAALSLFEGLIGRAYNKAKKRVLLVHTRADAPLNEPREAEAMTITMTSVPREISVRRLAEIIRGLGEISHHFLANPCIASTISRPSSCDCCA